MTHGAVTYFQEYCVLKGKANLMQKIRDFTEYCLELFNNNTKFINKRFLLKYSCFFLYYIIFVACLSENFFFRVVRILQ